MGDRIEAMFEVTKRCNFRCGSCRAWSVAREEDELDAGEWIGILREFPRCFRKPVSLTIGGGEPLLKPGLFDILDEAARQGCETTLTTNGYLIDEETAARIRAAKVSQVFISLNSIDPAVHDATRGMPGSFERTMRGIGLLASGPEAPRVMAGAVMMDATVDGLEALADAVQADDRISGISFQAMTAPFYTREQKDAYGPQGWFTDPAYAGLWPSDTQKLRRVIDGLIGRKRRPGSKICTSPGQFETFTGYYERPWEFVKRGACHLGSGHFAVGSRGDVFICFIKEPLDNVRRAGLADILGSQKASAMREEIKACTKNCQILVNCWYEE